MKRLILILFLLTNFSFASDFLDVDYNFIDSAFQGIKPVTNKEFDDTINRLTPKPVKNTFLGHLKAFLFGREYGVESKPALKEQQIDIGGDKKAIDDITNGIYYITLTAPIIGYQGKIIPLGNYKIFEKNVDSTPMLMFYQGRDQYGMLELKKFNDNLKKENDIAYYRIDVVHDNLIRIVYSTISDTKCALAKVYLQN